METGAEYSTGQTWAALRKSWQGYKIAKAKSDHEDMRLYAEQITTLQKRLNIPVSTFSIPRTSRPKFAACRICVEHGDHRQYPVEEMNPVGHIFVCDAHLQEMDGRELPA